MKKFSKILHPEIVLGLKSGADLGGAVSEATYYATIHSLIRWDEKRGFHYFSDKTNRQVHPCETASQHDNWIITKKFKDERPDVYHVGKEFLRAVSKIETEIPIDLLPAKWFGFFSFPQGAFFDYEGEEIIGVYVYIGPPEETTLKPELCAGSKKVFWGVYHTAKGNCARILMDLDAPKTFAQLAKDVPLDEGTAKGATVTIFAACMNLVLYVNSIDCDLKLAPPQHKMKPAEKKDRQQKGETINQCQLPVIFVSWNYQKPMRRWVGSSWVDTFMRWQRCGPNLSQVKLIWVTPFERHYKGVEKKEGE